VSKLYCSIFSIMKYYKNYKRFVDNAICTPISNLRLREVTSVHLQRILIWQGWKQLFRYKAFLFITR